MIESGASNPAELGMDSQQPAQENNTHLPDGRMPFDVINPVEPDLVDELTPETALPYDAIEEPKNEAAGNDALVKPEAAVVQTEQQLGQGPKKSSTDKNLTYKLGERLGESENPALVKGATGFTNAIEFLFKSRSPSELRTSIKNFFEGRRNRNP